VVINDGMSRAPVVRFVSAVRASEVKRWLEDGDNFARLSQCFNSTSRCVHAFNLFFLMKFGELCSILAQDCISFRMLYVVLL
jgi:hydroxymethylglutaryl-CoA reductase